MLKKIKKMKKSQLRKIIKESVKELMNEQSIYTQPFFDLANASQGMQPPQFIQNIITAVLNRHSADLAAGVSVIAPQGKGCQFVCNRLAHFVNKYNTKAQAAMTSGAGAAQGGFGHTNQGKILASKVNYLGNLGQNYNYIMAQVYGQTGMIAPGNCGCAPIHMM